MALAPRAGATRLPEDAGAWELRGRPYTGPPFFVAGVGGGTGHAGRHGEDPAPGPVTRQRADAFRVGPLRGRALDDVTTDRYTRPMRVDFLLAAALALAAPGCSKAPQRDAPEPIPPGQPAAADPQESDRKAFIDDFWRWSFGEAGLPDELARKVAAQAEAGPDFVMDLLTAVSGDPFLYALVDKTHPLPDGYVPDDLVELTGGSYAVARKGLQLRAEAAAALEAMAAAARDVGVTLTVGSSYRSYEYQVEVYNRNVREMGREAADRESARPGFSQHQTGLVVDFSPIDDSFAQTPAGLWVRANASRFGWSLSFPDGYEDATGYRWESWHYRYVGKDLAAFIDTYFDGIQQYALQFIHAWSERQ